MDLSGLTPSWRALVVALIYFGTFLTLGKLAKLVVDRWMARRGEDLSEVQRQAGPNRRPRDVFLLGAWRRED